MTRLQSRKRKELELGLSESVASKLRTDAASQNDIPAIIATLPDPTLIQVRMQMTLEHILAAQLSAAKQRKLEWALANSSLGAFDYYEDDGSLKSSKGRVEEVLVSFMGNGGRLVSTGRLELNGDEASRADFRQKLHDQISMLLGVPCKLEKVEDKFTLWYV